MKKTLAALIALGVVASVPAFAGNAQDTKTTTQSTFSKQVVYRTVKVPLTPEQVAERQQIGTRIEQTINRFDTNADRELNRAEFAYSAHLFNFNTDNKAAAFYETDTNHDGQLSSQELLKAELASKEAAIPVIEPASGTTRVIEKHTTTIVR